jgi:hypothetical protein
MTILAFGNCEGSGTIVDYSCVCIAVRGNEITAAAFYSAATSAWCSLVLLLGMWETGNAYSFSRLDRFDSCYSVRFPFLILYVL